MDKELRNNLIVLNFDSNKVPVFKEEKEKDWVIYGTEKPFQNRYPDYLLQLFNRSGKHNALITGKAHYIAGNGFKVSDIGISIIDKSNLELFLKTPNSYNETFAELAYKLVLDVEIFGGAYINGVWNKSGSDFEIFHIDYTRLRLDKTLTGYWYSEDWSKREQSEKKVEEGGTGLKFIPIYDPKNKKGNFILPFKEYRPGLKYYPLPGYIGAIPYAEIDYEISNFHSTNIKTGFNAGTIISFNNGRPLPEEKLEIEKKLKEKFTGTDNAGALMITFTQNKENEPTVIRITPSDLDKQFEILNKQCQEELFIGHRITSPMLFGVRVEGQLGGRDEILEADELFKSNYVVPKQKAINDFFNKILDFKGVKGKIELNETKPINERLSEGELVKVMTNAEIRKMAGLEPLKDDISSNNKTTDALSTISPLVANKILESMTPDEIRALVKLPPMPEQPIIEEPKQIISSSVHHFDCDCEKQEFSDKKRDIDDLRFYMEKGVSKSDYIILSQREAKFNSNIDCFLSEIENYEFGILDDDVKMIYRNIIDLLNKNPLMDAEELSKALNVDINKIEKAVGQLVKEGALKEGEKKSGDQKNPKWTPTTEAKNIIKDQPAKVEDLQILYSYEPRPGLKPIIPGTREFCKELYSAQKLFSRQEIERISSEVGYDVWSKRGGWWTKKGGGVVFPYCRHIWMQNVVKKK